MKREIFILTLLLALGISSYAFAADETETESVRDGSYKDSVDFAYQANEDEFFKKGGMDNEKDYAAPDAEIEESSVEQKYVPTGAHLPHRR